LQIAIRDLSGIREYSEANHGAAQAERYLAQLNKAVATLSRNPGFGVSREEFGKGVRALPIGKHLVLYRVHKKVLEIISVPHQAQSQQRKRLTRSRSKNLDRSR
jgi:toxin ParE1/3/4